jgi:histidinol phosphatase-like enzyme
MRETSRPPLSRTPHQLPAAVLFDRDGTLVRDVPYNGDPSRVEPMPGARAALDRLRAAGVRTAVVSNQSGVARGLLTRDQVDAVNARVEEVLGPLGPVPRLRARTGGRLRLPQARPRDGRGSGADARRPAVGLRADR